MFPLRLASLLLVLTISASAGAEGDLPPAESSRESAATAVRDRHGLFTSLSGSMGMMWLHWDDDRASISGVGTGLNAKLGYGVGMLSIFAEFNYETSLSSSEEGIGRFRLDELSFDFTTVGTGVALLSDAGYVSASWLFHAKSTVTGKRGLDSHLLESAGHGARLDAILAARSSAGWGVGVGPYFQWLSLTADNEEAASLTAYSYGLTLSASYY